MINIKQTIYLNVTLKVTDGQGPDFTLYSDRYIHVHNMEPYPLFTYVLHVNDSKVKPIDCIYCNCDILIFAIPLKDHYINTKIHCNTNIREVIKKFRLPS